MAVGLRSDAQVITESPVDSDDEWLTETARELKRSQKSVQHHRQFKCCVNILPKNMDKHLKSKIHLKVASDSV